MQASEYIRSKIKKQEGLMLHPYLDPPHNTKRLYSTGYGHQIQPGEKQLMNPITAEKAEALFNADLAIHEKAVAARLKRPATQGQFDALVDFSYNAGTGAAAKVVDTWNTTGDSLQVADHLRKYKYVTVGSEKRESKILVIRREFEATLFTGLSYANAEIAALKKKA